MHQLARQFDRLLKLDPTRAGCSFLGYEVIANVSPNQISVGKFLNSPDVPRLMNGHEAVITLAEFQTLKTFKTELARLFPELVNADHCPCIDQPNQLAMVQCHRYNYFNQW